MNELNVGEHDLLKYLRPDTLIGAIAYLVIFTLAALLHFRAPRRQTSAKIARSIPSESKP
jgi:hypothetical protein